MEAVDVGVELEPDEGEVPGDAKDEAVVWGVEVGLADDPVVVGAAVGGDVEDPAGVGLDEGEFVAVEVGEGVLPADGETKGVRDGDVVSAGVGVSVGL